MTRWNGWSKAFAAILLAAAVSLAGCEPSTPAKDNSTQSEKTPALTATAASPTPTAPASAAVPTSTAPVAAGFSPAAAKRGEWVSVFDGKTLANWKETAFDDPGKVHVEDGELILDIGKGDLTGVTWAGGALPKDDYEIALEAMRVDGEDFFCGLTFPVKDSCISLIVGGWGGPILGLSSLDGYDAYNNETTRMLSFSKGQWYRVHVRISSHRIMVWLDDDQQEDAHLRRQEGEGWVDRRVSVRNEVDLSQPFGLAAYRTKAALRNIRVRLLTDAEIKDEAAKTDGIQLW
jgi:hypothetical protein